MQPSLVKMRYQFSNAQLNWLKHHNSSLPTNQGKLINAADGWVDLYPSPIMLNSMHDSLINYEQAGEVRRKTEWCITKQFDAKQLFVYD